MKITVEIENAKGQTEKYTVNQVENFEEACQEVTKKIWGVHAYYRSETQAIFIDSHFCGGMLMAPRVTVTGIKFTQEVKK